MSLLVTRTRWSRRLRLAAQALMLSCALSAGAQAVPVDPSTVKDRTEQQPERLRDVHLIEKLGDSIPLALQFTRSDGKQLSLGDLVDGTRPTILTFNYSDCPMLCSLQLNGLVAGLKQIKRTPGEDFQIITISIDPKETLERATETKNRYIRQLGRPRAAEGWHFLTGPEERTRAVADSVGFGYTFNEERKEWLHTAAAIVLTPDGKVARYLYGIEYHPETLDLSVVEASEGKIGGAVEQLLLYCFHYDETEGRYAPAAMNIMRLGAGGVAVVLGIFLAMYWRRERRQRTPLSAAAHAEIPNERDSHWARSSKLGATEPKITES